MTRFAIGSDAESAVVSRIPSGSKIRVRMNVRNGSRAAVSTAALTTIQP